MFLRKLTKYETYKLSKCNLLLLLIFNLVYLHTHTQRKGAIILPKIGKVCNFSWTIRWIWTFLAIDNFLFVAIISTNIAQSSQFSILIIELQTFFSVIFKWMIFCVLILPFRQKINNILYFSHQIVLKCTNFSFT